MALIDQYTLSQDITYRNRVQAAVDTAVGQVAQEAASGNVSTDQRRNSLVNNYINNTEGLRSLILENFIQLSVTNPTIAGIAPSEPSISDGDIQFVVNSFVNTVAGVNQNNSDL